MAEDSELIGGISVSIGASHSQLVADIAEANRMLDTLEQRKVTVPIGGQFIGATGVPPAAAARGATGGGVVGAEATSLVRAMASLETSIARMAAGGSIGGGGTRYVGRAARSAEDEREATIQQYPPHLQAQIRAGLATQGVSGQGGVPGKLPTETMAPGIFRVDTKTAHTEIDAISADIEETHAEAAKPTVLAIDTKALQNDLQAILAMLKEVVGTAIEAKQATAAVAPTPAAAGGGRRPPRARVATAAGDEEDEPRAAAGPRRKNIRDRAAGTEAAQNRIYTYGGGLGVRPDIDERTGLVRPGPAQRGPSYYGGDTDELAHKQALAEAAAARKREMALTSTQQRAVATQAAQDRQAVTQAARADRAAQQQTARIAASNAQQAERAQREAFLNSAPPPGAGAPPLNVAGEASARAARDTPTSRAYAAVQRGNVRPETDTERAQREAQTRATAEQANRPRQAVDQSSTPTAAERENISQGRRAETRRQSFEERQQRALQSRQFQEAQIVRQQEQQQAVQQAQITAAGRTARTTASGLGAFFGGPRREQIEAQTALSAAQRETASATRYRNVFENELIRNEVKATGATVGEARALRDRNKEIKGSDQYRQAVNSQTEAIEREGKATERVAKLSQGFGTAARSLLSVTVAGAAFGVGLQAVSVAFQAAEKAASPYIDAITGYAQKTNDFTSALADQARQQQGNVQGVTALKLAQSGFAASSAASIQPIIAQRAQVEAGNKALQEQIDTFRVAEALRKQAGTAGLGGGTGGVLGTSLFGIPGTGEQTGNFLQGLGADVAARRSAAQAATSAPFAANQDPIGHFLGLNKSTPATRGAADQQAIIGAQAAFGRGLTLINGQLQQGGDGAAKFQQALSGTDARIEQTASAFDGLSDPMAAAIRQNHLYSEAISGSADSLSAAIAALKAINLAGTQIGPAEAAQAAKISLQNAAYSATRPSANEPSALELQQERARFAFEQDLRRQQGTQSRVQLPAQEALANLAAPPTPVGTGIRFSKHEQAGVQSEVNAKLKEAQDLQDGLNENYAKGQQILENTYKPAIIQTFGAAAGQVFSGLIADITSTGAAIAKIQAGISNEQAAYQTAQYNYQLFIAKRTLSDIGGLTDHNFGAGKSYLGVLEGQNLALSRQAQLLQFGLSQRQINFQRAVAGFTVPGLTPAEQNARVSEAKIEADYAQKQLNIQREMFRNQVKIVDISNLRQGADLVRQIGLLQQGRRVTIDTQAAQEQLERLNKRQQHLVAQAGTYINAVDNLISKASSDMAQLEAATGKALSQIAVQGVAAAYAVGRAFFIGASGGLLGQGGGVGKATTHPVSGANAPGKGHASGFLGSTRGMTPLGPGDYAGEASGELVAILSHPRTLTNLGGGGGGGTVTVNFNGDINVRSEADIDTLVRKITQAQGRTAALKGLRTPN